MPDHQLNIDDNERAIMAETYPNDPERQRRGLYEMEYYNLFGHLPAVTLVIERVEWYGDNVVIIHHDPNVMKQ
jgi:hypothetical protein